MAERPRKKAKKSETSTPGSESSSQVADAPRETNPLKYLNSDYLSAENAKKLAESFRKETPFPHASLSGFLDDAFLDKVKQELVKKEEWYIKNNDLYTFCQTDDLKNTKQPHVRLIHDIIYSKEFRQFMSTVTGIDLNDTIDSFGSRYWQGSQLLCHDDELEGRRIAFIFYLVPKDWNEKDGGKLELFDVDSQGQPDKIVRSITPQWNNFLFFEVSPVSFHQVAEVFTDEKERVAISGWFHGAPIKRPPRFVEPEPPRAIIKEGDKFNVAQWVNSRYLSAQIQKKVMNQFQATSSIALTDFLTKAKYQEVEKALKAKSVGWNMIGPANRRHYLSLARGADKAALQKAPAPVRDLMLFLRSPAFAEFLCKLTGLDYIDEVQSEVRKFEPGCYTLSQDNTEQQKDEGLDAILYFCDNAKDDDWDDNLGGTTNYMSEDAELATLTPAKNSLCLLFRAGGDRVMRFVKYMRANAPSLIDIASVYYDKTSPPSAPGDDDEEEMDYDGEEGGEDDDDEEEYEEDTRIPTI